VSLLGDIFQAAEKRHAVGGNIGTPLSSIITHQKEIDIAVLEISSFQLDTILDFRTRVAVLLNVTADHLDRYDNSFDKYAESKSRILNAADENTWFVYNEDDVVCRRIAAGYTGKKIPFGKDAVGDDGVYVHEDSIVRRWRGDVETVLPISEFSPVGIHNLENAMAAVAAATPFDIDARVVARALRAYRALPHRMELARVAGGVAYIDDSKATNVDATIKSVRSIDGHLVLIMGGIDKGGDYAPLVEHLGKVRRVILIGEASDKIEKALHGHCDIFRAATMEEAVKVASESVTTGDTVLLAPACSSFDMFSSYAERGDAFKAAASLL
jgi:UDP-N-acetylmuramoylalanine--D-glutamate ligase